MARPSHHKRLEKQRARRRAERAEHRRALRLVLALVAVLVVAAVALGAIFLTRGNGDQAGTDAGATTTDDAAVGAEGAGDGEAEAAVVEPCEAPTGELPEPVSSPYDERPTVDLGDVEVIRAEIATTCGTIVVELDAAAAPTTVNNFVALAEDGYYEGVGFHRVVDTFMIQGGDPTGTGTGCLDDACEQRLPGYTFDDELVLAEQLVEATGGYPRGTLAMANRGAPDVNGSQFFIIQGANGYPLPPQYAVFGSVVEGMDVVDRIAQGPTDGDLAVEPVIIRSVDVQR